MTLEGQFSRHTSMQFMMHLPSAAETELSFLSDKLSELCQQDLRQCSADDLSRLASDSTFCAYTRAIIGIVNQKRRVGAQAEALELIQIFEDAKNCWKSKLNNIYKLRLYKEDELKHSQAMSSELKHSQPTSSD